MWDVQASMVDLQANGLFLQTSGSGQDAKFLNLRRKQWNCRPCTVSQLAHTELNSRWEPRARRVRREAD